MIQFNPAGLFPHFNPGPSSIDTTYAKDGVKTVTQVPGAPMSSGPYQQLAAMIPAPAPARRSGGSSRSTKGTIRHLPQKKADDPLGRLKQMDQYEASLRGAATRPVGLTAGMIPGMAVDPRLLPQRMLPKQSGLEHGGLSDTQVTRGTRPGALSGPQMSAQDQANVLAGSNQGFDYLAPAEQQRWLAAARR